MNAQWVKNEWSRFQWMQKEEKDRLGKSNRVLICYLARGMRAEQIPKALNPSRQAIREGVKAHDELLTALSFLIKNSSSGNVEAHPEKEQKQNSYDSVISQLTTWLYLGKYEKVLEKYEQLTEEGLYLTKAQIHLAALCADHRVANIQKLVYSEKILDQMPHYNLAVTLCQEKEEREQLEKFLAENKAFQGRAGEPEAAVEAESAAESEAAEPWEHLHAEDHVVFGKYDDNPISWRVLGRDRQGLLLITDQVIDCRSMHDKKEPVTWEASTLRKWLNAEFLQDSFTEEEQKKIIFSRVPAHQRDQDSMDSGRVTRDQVFLLSVPEAEEYFRSDEDRQCAPSARAIKNGIRFREESNVCSWLLRTSDKDNRFFSNVDERGSDFGGLSGILAPSGIRPALRIAVSEQSAGQESGSASSAEKSAAGELTYLYDRDFHDLRRGECVSFGKHGNSPIRWRVLKKDDYKKEVLLIAEEAIACKGFHEMWKPVSWDNCSLRKWLNTEFLQEAFSQEEQKQIAASTVPGCRDPFFESTDETVTDQIFILSPEEAEEYFDSDEDRKCLLAPFARDDKAGADRAGRACWWWLRQKCKETCNFSCVESDGTVDRYGRYMIDRRGGVRPVLRASFRPYL